MRQKMMSSISNSRLKLIDDLYNICESHDDELKCGGMSFLYAEDNPNGQPDVILRAYNKVYITEDRRLMAEIRDSYTIDDSIVYSVSVNNMDIGSLHEIASLILI